MAPHSSRWTVGAYHVRWAKTAADVQRAQALRHLCFFGSVGVDADAFDPIMQHLLVERIADGRVLACCRARLFSDPTQIQQSYAAAFYDLASFASLNAPALEIGRLCLDPNQPDPQALRLIWGALCVEVDRAQAALLFGCTSFDGADPERHAQSLAHLAAHHLAPDCFKPGETDAPSVTLRPQPQTREQTKAALMGLPGLLRSYLALGGWVSHHAVQDPVLDTLHVLTGVEVARIPPARVKALRAVLAPTEAAALDPTAAAP